MAGYKDAANETTFACLWLFALLLQVVNWTWAYRVSLSTGVWSEFRSCKHRLASGSDQISEIWVQSIVSPRLPPTSARTFFKSIATSGDFEQQFLLGRSWDFSWASKIEFILKCRKLLVVPDLNSPELSDLNIFFERQLSPSPSPGIEGTPKVSEATWKELDWAKIVSRSRSK